MATLREVKSKGGRSIYTIDYMYQGRRYRKSTKTDDRNLAELFLKDIEVKIAKGNFGFDQSPKKRIHYSEFSEKYLQFSEATKAKNTKRLDEYFLDLFGKHIGNRDLRNITVGDVESYRIKRLEVVKPISVNIETKHLKSAFGTASKWGYIEENPFKKVKLLKIKESNLPKFFKKEEVSKLLHSVPEGLFKILILFYLYTGCRRNEALSLTWEDIDLQTGTVTFRHTKSGKSRVVPFNGALAVVIKSIEKEGERPFPFKSDYVTHKFKKLVKTSGIKHCELLNVHSLRHTYASHLVMAGVDLMTVSKLLGHSSIRVTEMYAHLVPDHLKASVERLRY